MLTQLNTWSLQMLKPLNTSQKWFEESLLLLDLARNNLECKEILAIIRLRRKKYEMDKDI